MLFHKLYLAYHPNKCLFIDFYFLICLNHSFLLLKYFKSIVKNLYFGKIFYWMNFFQCASDTHPTPFLWLILTYFYNTGNSFQCSQQHYFRITLNFFLMGYKLHNHYLYFQWSIWPTYCIYKLHQLYFICYQSNQHVYWMQYFMNNHTIDRHTSRDCKGQRKVEQIEFG